MSLAMLDGSHGDGQGVCITLKRRYGRLLCCGRRKRQLFLLRLLKKAVLGLICIDQFYKTNFIRQTNKWIQTRRIGSFEGHFTIPEDSRPAGPNLAAMPAADTGAGLDPANGRAGPLAPLMAELAPLMAEEDEGATEGD